MKSGVNSKGVEKGKTSNASPDSPNLPSHNKILLKQERDCNYFFKCTIKSITSAQDDACDVEVRPFAEYSVRSEGKTYVALLPNEQTTNGLLLKYDDVITIKNIKNLLCLLECSNNCTVYIKKVKKNKGDLTIGNFSYGVTKISVEV